MVAARAKPKPVKAAKAKPKKVAATPTPTRTSRSPRIHRSKKPSERHSYESAESTQENADHWPLADALNANAANNPQVRKVLRERARSERDNNGYCGGLVDRLSNDLIGTCPRLQLVIPGAGRDAARQVERNYGKWGKTINLGGKLRLLDNGAYVDGEGFGLLTTNPKLDPLGVQLDLRLYETDQIDTPLMKWNDPLSFAGGKLDEFGNVVEWHFLKAHPGSDVWLGGSQDYDSIPADRVVHWFKMRRAGQLRGVPEILSSLSLYAYMRRYTLAAVNAAEFGASHAGVLETDASADTEGAPTDVKSMDEVDVPRGKLLTLPSGYKAHGFDATQPNMAYREFKGEILTEAGAAVGAPRNISTGSSAEYNYSSGRLDHGIYQRGVGVRRSDLSDRVLDQIFRAFLDEAALVPGMIPDGLPPFSQWSWEWRFDGFSAIDPLKEANANDVALRNGSKTLSQVVGEDGGDGDEQLERLAFEENRRRELGLPSLLGASKPTASPAQQAANVEQQVTDAVAAA